MLALGYKCLPEFLTHSHQPSGGIMRRVPLIGLLVAMLTAAGLAVAPAQAVGTGNEGCTPGYWKNHTENWEEYSPSTTVGSVFNVNSTYASLTFEEALRLRGGPGVDGATRILLRAAVAAVLNAAHDGLGYPLRRGQIITMVNEALASGDRQTILEVKDELDRMNNLGCPLN
jgi:hypothetical protein